MRKLELKAMRSISIFEHNILPIIAPSIRITYFVSTWECSFINPIQKHIAVPRLIVAYNRENVAAVVIDAWNCIIIIVV